METIAERLKFIREEKYGKRGMSKFAKEIKVSPSGYLNYERGDRQIPSDVLARIAKYTSVNLHWLITGEDSPYSNQEISEQVASKIREEETIPLFKAAPALVNSLPLTKSNRNLLLNIIEKQSDRLSDFQPILHPDIVKGLDSSIAKEANGVVQDIPHLVKNCLMRATIGTIAAFLVPQITDYLREKDMQLALEYVRSIPDLNLSDKLSAYYSVMDGFIARDRTAEALQVVEEALEAIYQQDEPFERMRRLPSLVRWYARCNEMGKAHQIIVEANKKANTLKSSFVPQEIIMKFYRQLVEAEAEIGYLERAKKLLDKTLKLGREKLKDPESLNIHLSRCAAQYAYLSLKFVGQCNVLETKQSINKAKELIEQIDDPWHQIEALLVGPRVYYTYLNNSAQVSAIFLRAIDVAKSISDPTMLSMALARIIESCIYDDELNLAESLAAEISDPMEASSALLAIAFKHLSRNNQEKSKPFLNRAIRLVKKLPDVQDRTYNLNMIAMRLIESHEIEMALELAQRAVSENDQLVSLLQFIQTLLEKGEMNNSTSRKRKAAGGRRKFDNPFAEDIINKALLLAQKAISLAENGDINKAKKTIDKAVKTVAQFAMPSNQAKIYASIAQSLAKIGDQAQALRFLQKALQNASHSTRDVALDVIANLIPVIISLGGIKLLSDVYAELQRADEIFEV